MNTKLPNIVSRKCEHCRLPCLLVFPKRNKILSPSLSAPSIAPLHEPLSHAHAQVGVSLLSPVLAIRIQQHKDESFLLQK